MTQASVLQAIAISGSTFSFFTQCAGEIKNSTFLPQWIRQAANRFDEDVAAKRESKLPYYVWRHFERLREKEAESERVPAN